MVCKLKEDEKLDVAVVAMEREALKWYQWSNGRNPVHSWNDLKDRIHHQFRPLNVGVSTNSGWLPNKPTPCWNIGRGL